MVAATEETGGEYWQISLMQAQEAAEADSDATAVPMSTQEKVSMAEAAVVATSEKEGKDQIDAAAEEEACSQKVGRLLMRLAEAAQELPMREAVLEPPADSTSCTTRRTDR